MIRASLNDTELQEHIDRLEPDNMSVFVMAGGHFRGALFHGTRFVNQMRAQHQLGILETLVLGQASLCAALMIPTMKGRDRLVFRYDTDGPAAGFSVEADSTGSVRGYLLQDPIPVEAPPESWDLAPYFGPGTVTVTRFPEGGTEPVTGTVEIMHRNIAQDLTEYFLRSEQIRTAFNSSIKFDRQGRVTGAGGMFLQVMPGADDDEIVRAEAAFEACPSLGQWFADGGDRDDIIYGLFREFSPAVALERPVIFDCHCSKEKFGAVLRRLDKAEFDDMIANGPDPIEVICHNCGSVYLYTKKELLSEE